MISVTKKYENGKFSFLLCEDGREKCECFFLPMSAEITELSVYCETSEEEKRAAVLSVLGFLENSGKTEAFYVGKGFEDLFSKLGFVAAEGKLSVSLVGYFSCDCNKSK